MRFIAAISVVAFISGMAPTAFAGEINFEPSAEHLSTVTQTTTTTSGGGDAAAATSAGVGAGVILGIVLGAAVVVGVVLYFALRNTDTAAAVRNGKPMPIQGPALVRW